MTPNRPKVPIFIRRQLPKTIPSRLSPEEIEAAASPAQKTTSEAPIESPTTEQVVAKPEVIAEPKATPKPAPTPTVKAKPETEPEPTEPVEPESTKPVAPKKPKQPRLKQLAVIAKPFSLARQLLTKPALDTWLLVVSLVALLVTQLTLIWFTRTGLGLNMASLLLLTLLALFRESLRKVAISLAIIPVAQMVGSTIVTHTAFQTATVLYAILLVLALIYRYLFTLDEPVTASRLAWKGHFFGLPLMLVLGQLLGLLGYGLLRHHYDFTRTSLPLVFAATIVFAFAEEMLLRGLIQQQAARATNSVLAVVISSSLYAVLTISHGTMLSIIPAVATGVTLALVYHFKRNLILTTAVNAASKLAYVGLVATFILR